MPYRYRPLRKRRRHLIAAIACIAVVLGVLVPIALSIWAADKLARYETRAVLSGISKAVADMTERASAQAHEVLDAISTGTGCSEARIADMRRLVQTNYFIDEIGYTAPDGTTCTSWGPGPLSIPDGEMQATFSDGVSARFYVQPTEPGTEVASVVYQNDHYVMISQGRLLNAPFAARFEIAVAYALPGDPERHVLVSTTRDAAVAIAAIDPGLLPEGAILPETLPTVVQHRSGNLIAAASVSNGALAGIPIRPYFPIFLTLGIVVAGLIVSNVIWLSRRQLSLRHQFLDALTNDEFRLVYQPIFDLRTGACIGAEALTRWSRDDGDHVGPDIFVPFAEQEKLVGKLTVFVIDRVCRDLGDLLRDNPDFHVSINLAPEDLAEDKVLAHLAQALKAARIPPQSVWLEMTERGLIDAARSRSVLSDLRAVGHKLAIDDFGTGFSSLQYLQDLPVDALKIDKSFVDTIGLETANSMVISHIIKLAAALDLDVVAEGVSNRQQLVYLSDHAVQYAQGYHFSPPLELDAFLSFRERSAATSGPGRTSAEALG